MKTTASNRKIRKLLTAIREETLVPRPEFQRRLVWANKHKIAFLETVLKDYPFPEIYIAAGDVDTETGEGTEMLVDGQQRITTLFQYFVASDELSLGGKIPAYSDLDEDQKRAFLEYDVVIRDLGSVSLDEIKEIFRRINSTNYSVNAMEIHNSRFDGELIELAEQIAQHSVFNDYEVFSANEVRRMQDVRFVLVLIITMMSTYFNRDDELENYLTAYNESFPDRDRWETVFIDALNQISALNLSTKSRAWKKADLFTLAVEISFIQREGIELDWTEVGQRLETFYGGIDNFSKLKRPAKHYTSYYKAALQATNDKGNRVTRGKVIRDVLLGKVAVKPIANGNE
jgi:hypothetical protein